MATGAARRNERTHAYPSTQFSEKRRSVYYDELKGRVACFSTCGPGGEIGRRKGLKICKKQLITIAHGY